MIHRRTRESGALDNFLARPRSFVTRDRSWPGAFPSGAGVSADDPTVQQAGQPLTRSGSGAVRVVGMHNNSLLTHPHRRKIRQPNNRKPLMISMAAAVLPWTPKATALLPPWCKTIAASLRGMIVATSINQPSGCADP